MGTPPHSEQQLDADSEATCFSMHGGEGALALTSAPDPSTSSAASIEAATRSGRPPELTRNSVAPHAPLRSPPPPVECDGSTSLHVEPLAACPSSPGTRSCVTGEGPMDHSGPSSAQDAGTCFDQHSPLARAPMLTPTPPPSESTWIRGFDPQAPCSDLLVLVVGGPKIGRRVASSYHHHLRDPPAHPALQWFGKERDNVNAQEQSLPARDRKLRAWNS